MAPQSPASAGVLAAVATGTDRPLAGYAWASIPGSSMNSVFVPGVDDAFSQAPNSWRMIQGAWSGGVCVDDELFVWGGGHGDGAHNGLLAVDVKTGKWRRVTEPSPIWSEELCPGGVCRAVTGECDFKRCNTGPDGRPVARHTYYLMASDGQSIYSVGGGKWRGGGGDPPRAWKFDLASVEWSPLKHESPVTKPHGSLVYAKGSLYHMTAAGLATMDVTSGEWSVPNKRARGASGMTGLVYVPTLDRLYALGNSKAWYVERPNWGQSGQPIASPPALLESEYLGMTYYPPEDLILIWGGGATITTLDPHTGRWAEATPSGDPGPRMTRGAFARFSYCGGRVVLVDDVSRDLFLLAPDGLEGKPTGEKATGSQAGSSPDFLLTKQPEPGPRPDESETTDSSGRPRRPSRDSISTATAVGAPYYEAPPGDRLVEEQCGPVTSWDALDVRTNEEMEALRSLVPGKRILARIHWKQDPYPVAYVKGAECVKLEGIAGPTGEKPLVGGVNATHAWRGEVRRGGILIDGLEISPGKVLESHPELEVNSNCVGVPNDQMFVIIRNSYVGRCGHHAFITAHAHHLYVEVAGSQFEQAASHLAYIDHIAMAYIHDSTFQSPGWGHALRCVALRCVIERVRVSNVQLDGTTLPRGGDNPFHPKRTYIGMHPFEIYTCGENEVRDVEVVFRADSDRNGGFAAILRGREAFRTCDVGEVVDGQWSPLTWGDPEFSRSERWVSVTPLHTRVEGMKITCVGGKACSGWSVKGAYPTMDDKQKAELQKWLKSRTFTSWEDLVAQIPVANPEWRWVADVTLPAHRSAFMTGRITNKVPLPVPLPGWFQRSQIVLKDVSVDGGEILEAPEEPATYCYGVSPRMDVGGNVTNECPEQYDGLRFRQALVTVLP